MRIAFTTLHNTNYARFDCFKKTANAAKIAQNVHVITSDNQREAIDLIRWVYAVAKLPADSPRFNWYVSRWQVPDKIAAAKLAGRFDSAVANCPPIDPSWVRFVPAALAAADEFKNAYMTPRKITPASSGERPIEIKRNKKAA